MCVWGAKIALAPGENRMLRKSTSKRLCSVLELFKNNTGFTERIGPPPQWLREAPNRHFMDAYKTAGKVPSTNSLLLTWTFMTHLHGEGAGTGALFLGNEANSGPIQARSFAG